MVTDGQSLDWEFPSFGSLFKNEIKASSLGLGLRISTDSHAVLVLEGHCPYKEKVEWHTS